MQLGVQYTPPHSEREMDEIDFHGDFVDSNSYEEYFGEGSLGSVAPEQLAQSILESLQGLKSSYAVENEDLEPLVGLLNDVFSLVECIPGLRAGYNTLEEERDELERHWRKEKDKYKKRMEVGGLHCQTCVRAN